MKTYRHLYPQIYDYRNLIAAWKNARRGKRYSASAATFEQNLDIELVALHHAISGLYGVPGPPPPEAIKRHLLSAAPKQALYGLPDGRFVALGIECQHPGMDRPCAAWGYLELARQHIAGSRFVICPISRQFSPRPRHFCCGC